MTTDLNALGTEPGDRGDLLVFVGNIDFFVAILLLLGNRIIRLSDYMSSVVTCASIVRRLEIDQLITLAAGNDVEQETLLASVDGNNVLGKSLDTG